ncbi:MAG: hypothetical protein COB49_07430 [Alphaproteobacteria bacterium]|nr:MAG: hypothetical protein COB49_07430 [Alphaproteobacteria bacterium]
MDIEVITRSSGQSGSKPHLLFVHGGFHGAWCWDENFLPWFTEHEWSTHALSLRGHGVSVGTKNINSWGLVDYVEDVLSVIDELGVPVILIGHSMGGVISQMCREVRPDVVGMVLIASSPMRISPWVLVKAILKHPIAMIGGQIFRNMEISKPAYIDFFFSKKLDPKKRERYVKELSGESFKAITELFSRQAPTIDPNDKRPSLIIAGDDDWSIPMRDHKILSRTYSAPLKVCPGVHDIMLEPEWEVTARVILEWLVASFQEEAHIRPDLSVANK